MGNERQTSGLSQWSVFKRCFYPVDEMSEKTIRIMWAWGRFWMELNRSNRTVCMLESCDCSIIQVNMGDDTPGFDHRCLIDCKAMILTRDLNSTRFEIVDRMVCSAVSEREFVG